MPKILISYRREDSAGVAGRIYDRLLAQFGGASIFMDVDNIPIGVDFREHIDAAVSTCDLVLAVIGSKWTGELGNRRRIDDPKDFVRIELECALKRNIPVIPILIDRTVMPAEADLPPSLGGLTYRNGVEVDQGRDFHPHVDRLIRGIQFHLERANPEPSAPSSEPSSKPAAAKDAERPRRETPPQDRERPRPAPSADARPGATAAPSTSNPAPEPNTSREGGDRSKPDGSRAGGSGRQSARGAEKRTVRPWHWAGVLSTVLGAAATAQRHMRPAITRVTASPVFGTLRSVKAGSSPAITRVVVALVCALLGIMLIVIMFVVATNNRGDGSSGAPIGKTSPSDARAKADDSGYGVKGPAPKTLGKRG
jgi:hypothetical protein